MKQITWEKGLFSSTYKLYEHNEKIGEYSQSPFNRSSVGNMNGSIFKFTKKGYFNSNTDITDLSSNRFVGNVKFNNWGNKAEITIDQKKYYWKYDNFWNSKWSISDNNLKLISFKSSTDSGEIESSVESNLLILSGLFVHNHYLISIIIVVIMTIIISSR